MLTSSNYQCQKGVQNFFPLFIFDLFVKIKKIWFQLHTRVLHFSLINNLRSKQTKKSPERALVEIVKLETYTKFQQKIFKSVVLGARQCFKFFRQIAWFFGNNRALPKFR